MDGLRTTSELLIPAGNITDNQLDALLQVLAAKNSLSNDEIALCYYRKNCKNYSPLLEVHYEAAHRMRSCGENPYCTASLVDENKHIILPPLLDKD